MSIEQELRGCLRTQHGFRPLYIVEGVPKSVGNQEAAERGLRDACEGCVSGPCRIYVNSSEPVPTARQLELL
jgi:hypothetical protein